MRSLSKFVIIAGLAGGLAACAQQSVEKTLYDRLGGQPALTAVIDDFVANVAADPAINKRFAAADIPKLKKLLVEQVCAAAGGPCKYTGRTMKESHKGMDITTAEFNAMGGDMLKTLEKFKVPEREKNEVMALLGSMSKDVVGQ